MNYFFLFSILLLTTVTDKAQNFINPSLENWGPVNICQINTPPDSWSEYSNGGLGADKARFPNCASTIPSHASNGVSYARMSATSPTSGEGFYQNVSGFTIGVSYPISFDYAGSDLFGGTIDIQIHLFIDDIDVAQTPIYSSVDTVWTPFNHSFIASAATHKIGIRCYVAPPGIFGSTGSGGIDNFQFAYSVGMKNIDNKRVAEVFPNPFQNAISILSTDNTESEITLFDVTSRTVIQKSFTNSTILNTDQLAKGIYIYEIRNKNQRIKSGKIIKE